MLVVSYVCMCMFCDKSSSPSSGKFSLGRAKLISTSLFVTFKLEQN